MAHHQRNNIPAVLGIGGSMETLTEENMTFGKCDKIIKHFQIGFTESELKEINTAFEKRETGKPRFEKIQRFIRYLVLYCLDLEKENRQLKSLIFQNVNRGKLCH
jgi:hypothetical protein